MSVGAASTSKVAVLGGQGSAAMGRARADEVRRGVRMAAFGALALYGTLKWSKLLSGGDLARLLGLLVLALLLAGGRPALARRSRLAAAVVTIVVLVMALPLAGVPLSWVVHLRIAVTARAIGHGLSALPQVLVPYSGANRWVTVVIVLGAAVLLFDAALLVAFAPGRMEDLRRAGAALPLVALAVVPTTLIRPSVPYIDGAVLFALLVAFVWGEEIGRRRVGGALGLGVVALIAALFVAPALDQHKPWFNYRGLAGSLAPTAVEAFDWSQGYGPIDWPRSGRLMLAVHAAQGEYWKTENLDAFNGAGWAQGSVPGAASMARPDASALRRWTQTIEVTVHDMRSSAVIGAGTSTEPTLPQGVSPGLSPGTWTAGSELGPGQSYQLSVYAPDPSPSQLDAAGADYASVPSGYLAVELPPARGTPSPDSNFLPGERASGDQPVLVFPAFHSGGVIRTSDGPPRVGGSALIDGSRWYGPVYRLAQRLSVGAATPWQFVQAVGRYLARNYAYNEHPPRSGYPLYTFLFSSHRGYCQQFAGAMALLLRMGGVPARVAVGFTRGRLNSSSHEWLVTDFDAHAWVEAWFPHYGWVTFDPTPPAHDPAQSNTTPVATSAAGISFAPAGAGSASKEHPRGRTPIKRSRAASGNRGSTRGGFTASDGLPWLAVLVAVVLLGLLVAATKPLGSDEAMVAELERALNRIGRPLPGGATLTWLERRVGGSADAAAYVRALRMSRFGGEAGQPTRSQRRALRRQLRLGRGPLGLLRAGWALPPRWVAPWGRGPHGWRGSRAGTERGPGS
jgi:transglutaminase-like putative cysteine protease